MGIQLQVSPIIKFSCDWIPAIGYPSDCMMNDYFCYCYDNQNDFWILIGQWHMHIKGAEYKTE